MRREQIAIAARGQQIARVMAAAVRLRSGTECRYGFGGAGRRHQLAYDRDERDEAHGNDAKPYAESSADT
jgi:hypothetical protein